MTFYGSTCAAVFVSCAVINCGNTGGKQMNTEKTKGTGSSRTPFIRQLIRLTESAVLVALAIGLSYLELDIGLQGGSRVL